MKKIIIAIKDKKNPYERIEAVNSLEGLKRDFTDFVNTPNTVANLHPEDFDLVQLGFLNCDDGSIEPEVALLLSAEEVYRGDK